MGELDSRPMAKPGTVFVAVGAGHLAGPVSVQQMLTAYGLKLSGFAIERGSPKPALPDFVAFDITADCL